MKHTDAIDAITGALRDTPGIKALFLSGSYGTGLEDAYSDIDFVMVAADGASDDVAGLWHRAVSKTGEIVLWWDRTVRPVLINAITEDWLRIDLMILKPDQMGGQKQDSLKPLFDHDRIYDTLPEVTAKPIPTPAYAKYQFEEFIRILGLLPLAVGRKEYINGVLGVFHLRNLLVDLLIAETGVRHRGGALHLNRLITEDQKDILTALPPPVATRDQMIAGHMAYAKAYLPRARRLAKQWGVDWPERFEAATWKQLNNTLSIERPYNPD
ncbi:nucleotidyltransferase domain-containing protein [Rhodophyticola sp. CCM32]|uniref:nucleotidyltransferase domain-containing protein n=1 Tax=Rhodophyticola sp. CCM32 TaxID=2916397 RepID=UPI00107FB249|nr:nucleotidyltransferase domain-containing protein [Rhodophyticola sp. CCM32]QBY01660.1 nucleotidyltransferase domain-containing protein [Rhodophyticola sp. CCM32]